MDPLRDLLQDLDRPAGFRRLLAPGERPIDLLLKHREKMEGSLGSLVQWITNRTPAESWANHKLILSDGLALPPEAVAAIAESDEFRRWAKALRA